MRWHDPWDERPEAALWADDGSGARRSSGTLQLDEEAVSAHISEARRSVRTQPSDARPSPAPPPSPSWDDEVDADGWMGGATLESLDEDAARAYIDSQRQGHRNEGTRARGSRMRYRGGSFERTQDDGSTSPTRALPHTAQPAGPSARAVQRVGPSDPNEATVALDASTLDFGPTHEPDAAASTASARSDEHASSERHLMVFDDRGAASPLPLEVDTFEIGRAMQHHLVLADAACSRHHATIRVTANRVEILDHDTEAGTFINGCPIRHAVFRPGDVVRIGAHRIALVEGPVERRHYKLTESHAPPEMLDIARRRPSGFVGRIAGLFKGKSRDDTQD